MTLSPTSGGPRAVRYFAMPFAMGGGGRWSTAQSPQRIRINECRRA